MPISDLVCFSHNYQWITLKKIKNKNRKKLVLLYFAVSITRYRYCNKPMPKALCRYLRTDVF